MSSQTFRLVNPAAPPLLQLTGMSRSDIVSHMDEKPEGDLKSIWIFPVSLFLYMVVLAVIGYFVFLS